MAGKCLTLLVAVAATGFGVSGAIAEKAYGPGVSDVEIKIGQSMPYSGAASSYGVIGKAETAYFQMVNDKGGVNGRKITLLSLDDGYSPPKTVEQTRRLVEEDKVLLIFSTFGTPTNAVIKKYLNGAKVPQLFPTGGATQWDDPKHAPWTMGWQPNYFHEAKLYAQYILKHKLDARVAVLYQNDDIGKDNLRGLREGLGADADRMIVKTASYEITDPTIDSQVITLQGAGANVFWNSGAGKFASQAIRKAYDIGWHPLQFVSNYSSSVAAVFVPAGLEKAAGIISTQFEKDPTDKQWRDDPGYKEWLAWMDKYQPGGDKTDIFNVYGYSTAQTLVQVLKQCGDDLTRQNVMRQAESLKNVELPMLLPGILMNTSPTDHLPIKDLRLIRFNGRSWEVLGNS